MTLVSGLLLGDQRADRLYLLRDLNQDGDAFDEGERVTFFDETNSSGLAAPTSNIFGVFQDSNGYVYVGDGDTDTVYRLRDGNGDGDANDAGEAVAFFTPGNFAGFSTITPQSIAQGFDGAIYLSNAGVTSRPQDAIYRLQDLNGDGDTNDKKEATVWLDMQAISTPDGTPQGAAAVPYDIVFDGDVAYINDLNGGSLDDVIHRAEDVSGDGKVTANEVKPFISDKMNFGAPVDLSSAVWQGGLVTLTWTPNRTEVGSEPKLYSLNDWNGSGDIDQSYEAREVWNASELPDGYEVGVGFNVTAVGDTVYFTADEHVIALNDVNGDHDFLDTGETKVLTSGLDDSEVIRPRALSGYRLETDLPQSQTGTAKHDRLDGGAAADNLDGGNGRDTIYGHGGDDIISGGQGQDALNGGDGDDFLRGDHGKDVLSGGNGDDLLSGGSGADTFIFTSGNDRIIDFAKADHLVFQLGDTIPEDAVITDYARAEGDALFLDFGAAGTFLLDGAARFDLDQILYEFV